MRFRLTSSIVAAGCIAVALSNLFSRNHDEIDLGGEMRQSLKAFRLQKTQIPGNSSLSACLLLKDDNDILGEYLAYHYHTMNLRHILVAVDPSSETSPSAILQEWQERTDLRATLWSDKDYMPEPFLEKGYHIPPGLIKTDANASKWHVGFEDAETVRRDTMNIQNHRFRQVTFLSACLQHFRKKGHRWVIHTDTDEYIVVNPLLRQNPSRIVHVPSNLSTPNALFQMMDAIPKSKQILKSSNYPCISMPRLLFGSVEDSNTTKSNLETMRWIHHTSYEDKERNAQPKVLIDVSEVSLDDEMFKAKPFSIHRPSKAKCRRIGQLSFKRTEDYPFAVNHYLGSWERYVGRNDTRRSRRAYDFKAFVNYGKDTWIQSWFGGFNASFSAHDVRTLLRT